MSADTTRAQVERDVPGWPAPLVEAYGSDRRKLVRLAYLMTGSRETAEEIVHEAFLATRRNWGNVRGAGPYLRTAVVNGCRTWMRRQSLERRYRRTERVTDSQQPDELWDALGRLTSRQRAAIVLRYYEDLPDVEIAAALGCREATVRTTIHRALAALRREIER